MSATKAFLEDLSVEMGFDGEITEEVIAEGLKRKPVKCSICGKSCGTDKGLIGSPKVAHFECFKREIRGRLV